MGHRGVVDGEHLYGALVCVGRPANECFQVAEVAYAIAPLRAEGEDGDGTSGHLVLLAGEEGFFLYAYVCLARLERRWSEETVIARFPFADILPILSERHIFILERGGQDGGVHGQLPDVGAYFVHSERGVFSPFSQRSAIA